MKRTILAALCGALVIGLSAPDPALADESVTARVKKTRKKMKQFDFTGDDIEATAVRPDGDDMNVPLFATHANLVRIRQTFVKEILKSTEDI